LRCLCCPRSNRGVVLKLDAIISDSYAVPSPLPIPAILRESAFREPIVGDLRIIRDRFPKMNRVDPAFAATLKPDLSSADKLGKRRGLAGFVSFSYLLLISFADRRGAFRLLARSPDNRDRKIHLELGRDHIFEQGCAALRWVGLFSHNFIVKFPAERGDGIGSEQQFFTLFALEFAQRPLWRDRSLGLFPVCNADESLMRNFGVFCGLALVVECQLPLHFNPAFFAIAQGRRVPLGDVDPEIAAAIADPDGLAFVDPLLRLSSSLEVRTSPSTKVMRGNMRG
jgi:hypothetical protein